MCGIAGILGRVDDTNRAALQRMTAALVHRGPDDSGLWESPADRDGRGCLLGFRRLAILDLSPAAHQPMTDPVTGHTMVFNGEIYSYAELRRQLTAEGQTFASSGDSAVLLRLLSLHGAAAVPRVRGMYALALWDPHERQLLLARDPHGMKPLYVCSNPDPEGGWSFAFASEVRALLASGLLRDPRLDPAAVESVLWNGFVAGPGTAVAGVGSVLPGDLEVRDVRGRRLTTTTHWAPAADPAPTTTKDLEAALAEAVALHLDADVPLGVFLSGGVDSSAVANLAQRAQPDRRLRTFTLAFEEEAMSEGPAAACIAAAIGTDHQEVVLTEGDFVSGLDAALDSLDQPTFDAINSYVLAGAVRAAGLTVALAGTGGDELFGGYETFRQLPTLLDWHRRGAWLPTGAKTAAARAVRLVTQRGRGGPVPPQTRWAKLPAMVGAGGDLVALYQLSYALFLPDLQEELRATSSVAALDQGLPAALRSRVEQDVAGQPPLAALSRLEQRLFLGERLLRDSDAASMAVSLELRLPLVDHVLTDCVAGLPEDQRYRPVGRKQALRDAGLGGLDPRTVRGAKRGFQLPFEDWIGRHLGAAMDETMRDTTAAAAAGLDSIVVTRLWEAYRAGAPGLYWSRVWAVYVLIRWCEANGVRL